LTRTPLFPFRSSFSVDMAETSETTEKVAESQAEAPARKNETSEAAQKADTSEMMKKALPRLRGQGSAQAEARAKALNLGTVDTHGGHGAGAGGGFGLNAPGFHVKVRGPQAAHGSNIAIDPAVHAAWTRVMDDTDPLGWVIVRYKAGRLPLETGKGMELDQSGEGGLSDFRAALPADAIAWGAFRCFAVDQRSEPHIYGGALQDFKRPKFVLVQFSCEAVSQIKRAKMGAHKGDVKKALSGCHMDIMIEKPDDLEEQDLIKQLQAATGARKPSGYEFDEGSFLPRSRSFSRGLFRLGIGAAL